MAEKEDTERIYLDNVAATPVRDEVMRAMEPYWQEEYGNPGGKHSFGVNAKAAVNSSRKTIADLICVLPDEIVFTGSGTEANNLAISGVLKYLRRKESKPLAELHLITTTIEHPSVLDLIGEYEEDGAEVTYIQPDESGIVSAESVADALKEKTILISVMAVNNELGVIQPIEEIGREILKFKKQHSRERSYPYFHTDASQAALYTHIDVRKMHVDLLTLDAQKMYGPKGVGALMKLRHVNLSPVLVGGGQERGLRPGTENVPLIVGLAKAHELAIEERDSEIKRLHKLQQRLVNFLETDVPGAVINGSKGARLPNNVNFSLPGIDNEQFVIMLDQKGIACGTRSACMRERGSSYVIESMGLGVERAESSLRFSLGRYTTEEQLEATLKAIKEVATKIDIAQ